MSDSQHHAPHNPDMDAAAFEGGNAIGRGTGFTIKQMKENIRAWFRRNKMPNRQWKTLAEKQALIRKEARRVEKLAAKEHLAPTLSPLASEANVEKEKPIRFKPAQQHSVGGPDAVSGIKLKKFPKDVWDEL